MNTVGGYQLLAAPSAGPDALTSGETAVDRNTASSEYPIDTGTIFFTFFTAQKTEPITKIRTGVYGTAASGLTLARVGVWSVAANADLTPLASSANDTTMWTAAYTRYAKALTSTWNKTAGQRYAVGILAVGTTMPVLAAQGVKFLDVADGPRIQGELAGQSDFPGSVIAAATLADGYRRFQAILQP